MHALDYGTISKRKAKVEKFDPKTLCHPALLDVSAYQTGTTAKQIESRYGISDAIKLSSNENLLGPGEQVLQAMNDCDWSHGDWNLNRYPDSGGQSLKKALAKRHSTTPQHITLGNGSNEVLELIARCFLAPGKNAIYSQHAFCVYPSIVRLSGADPKVAQARPGDDEKMPYGNNLEEIHRLIDAQTAVIFIANPNNPTGTWLSTSELHSFIADLPPHLVVVMDEAYAEYTDASDCADCTQWLSEFDNLIVTRTFSKLFGLAGLRIGYALSSPAIASLLNAVRQPFNANLLAQELAMIALTDTAHIEKSITTNRQGLQAVAKGLADMGIRCLPSCANFICYEAGDAKAVYQGLVKKGVIVRPIEEYNLPDYLRVTIGAPQHNQRFLAAMQEVLDLNP